MLTSSGLEVHIPQLGVLTLECLAARDGKSVDTVGNLLVGRNEHEIVVKRLTNEHPMERVSVMSRQIEQARNGGGFEGQRSDSVLLLPTLEILISRSR